MSLNSRPLIKVTSPSFSKNHLLASELKRLPSRVMLNETGLHFNKQSLVNFLIDADGAIIGLESVNVGLLDKCPRLKIISQRIWPFHKIIFTKFWRQSSLKNLLHTFP